MARLGDVCDILNGFAFKSEQYVEEGIRIIRIANVQKGFIEDSAPVFYPFGSKDTKKYSLEEGDMLMSLTGNVGRVAKLSKEFLPAALNQRVACLRIKDGVALDKAFLFNLLNSDYFEQQCIAASKGVAQKNISTEWLKEYEIPMFSMKQQKVIASVLDKVTELIAMRKEQLAKIDQLVKSRFIELFGDNNYPSEPLDNNVVEMFIGPFGSSLKNEVFVDEENGFCMVYEQKHAIQKTMNVPTRYVPKSKYEELKRFTIWGGDIIVSCRGTIGEIFIVPDNAPMGIMHPSIMKIRLNTEKYNQKFFVFALEQYMDEHNAEAKGSGVKMAVSATVLGQSDFVVPPMEVQNQFAAFVEQTDKSKLAIQQSLDKLELLKKSLMQEYFG